jgi:mycobactin polyketide synthetase MbtC
MPDQPTESTYPADADPVVIVGMALEAPGGIDTVDGYWALLSQRREALGPFPTDRGWPVRDLLTGSRRAGFKPIHDCGGDCDMALAGGVCVMGSPGYFVEFSKQHALSDDGHCRPYSAGASGTVWAEGAAMFVLQRKSAALRYGRRILAEVLASVVNQDGRSAGLSAPSYAAQARLFRRAVALVGVRPERVGMVEGHGTGTRIGDRAELRSLSTTYGDTEPGHGPLLGSVKSNVGHAQAAAGALGLGKVLLSADHGAVPATLHVESASREIDWDSQGLRLAQELSPWPAVGGQRIAAVSAFGISGTNVHAIVSVPEVV